MYSKYILEKIRLLSFLWKILCIFAILNLYPRHLWTLYEVCEELSSKFPCNDEFLKKTYLNNLHVSKSRLLLCKIHHYLIQNRCIQSGLSKVSFLISDVPFFRLKKCYTVGMRADCVVPEDQCLKKRMAKNKSNGMYLFLSASKDKLLRLLELNFLKDSI